jgi:hypothetical protein
MTKAIRLIVGALATLVLLSDRMPSGMVLGPARASAAPVLTDLKGIEELKTFFNRDAGRVRLVLLLSPT